MRNTGDGSWVDTGSIIRTNREVGVYTSRLSTMMDDVDADGDLDLVTTDHTEWRLSAPTVPVGDVYLNDGRGIFTHVQNLPLPGFSITAFGDVDGDGDVDICSSSPLIAWLNDGQGFFTDHGTTGEGLAFTNGFGDTDQPATLFVTDLQGDNDLDVIASGASSGSDVYLNNGAGTFQKHVNEDSFVTPGPRVRHMTDFNGDGRGGDVFIKQNSPFGVPPPGYILNLEHPFVLGDQVWEDLNQNGIQDNGEPPVAGVQIEAYHEGGHLLERVTSNRLGDYYFQHIAYYTNYTIRVTLPRGYGFTQANQGSDTSLDSNFAGSEISLYDTNQVDRTGLDLGLIDLDADDDRMLDQDEIIAGTDPNDPHSLLWLRVESLEPTGEYQLTFPSETSRFYRVEYATNLFEEAAWKVSQTMLPIDGGLQQLRVTNETGKVYYRIGVEPAP